MNAETTAIVLATALGPITAVLITLWHQDRKQKRDIKERLFLTLMAHRKFLPPTVEWANALNLIDVVFGDHPKVVKAWHDLYDFLHIKPLDMKQYEHKNLELLSQIAETLGYKSLRQIDIDKFYSPQAHVDQVAMASKLQSELLRFLTNIADHAAAQSPKDNDSASLKKSP